tara:strand:- start:1255 stop:1620 length:366 start_codon:yes stop_codon:yes gene_type:complete
MHTNEQQLSSSEFFLKKGVLTNRQLQTLLASLHGQTSKEVAKAFAVSPRTVEDHWKEIHQKFRKNTGYHLTKSQIIENFLENAEKYLDTPDSMSLVQEIRQYKNSIMLIREKFGKQLTQSH